MALAVNLTKTQTYTEDRQNEYPKIKNQMDMLWHAIDDGVFGNSAKSTDFYTQLKAVKDKYPKS
tara:strand:- start:1952 stop:2143 length:192 start_codon:yes stop_codon:yes gene_type:complete